MQKSRSCQPWHEGRNFHRIPSPISAPPQHIVSPTTAKNQTQRKEKPGPQGPPSGNPNPAVIASSGDQGCNGKGKGHHEGDKSKIEHGRVDDHSRVPQQGVQSISVSWDKGHAVGRLKCGWKYFPANSLPQSGKWVFKENVQCKKKAQSNHTDQDHPGQKCSISPPITPHNCGCKCG